MSEGDTPPSPVHSWEDLLLDSDSTKSYNSETTDTPVIPPTKTDVQFRLISLANSSQNYFFSSNLCINHSAYVMLPLMSKHWSIIAPRFCTNDNCYACNLINE